MKACLIKLAGSRTISSANRRHRTPIRAHQQVKTRPQTYIKMIPLPAWLELRKRNAILTKILIFFPAARERRQEVEVLFLIFRPLFDGRHRAGLFQKMRY